MADKLKVDTPYAGCWAEVINSFLPPLTDKQLRDKRAGFVLPNAVTVKCLKARHK